MLYDNWLHKLSESYTNSHNINESEMILEELNETKEYVNILEGVLNTLLEQEVITEEDIVNIVEVLTPDERFRMIRDRTGHMDHDLDQAVTAEFKRRRDLERANNFNRGGTDRTLMRTSGIRLGTDPDRGISDRALVGGIQPENAERILRMTAAKSGLPKPSKKSIGDFIALARDGRAARAQLRKLSRNKKQG